MSINTSGSIRQALGRARGLGSRYVDRVKKCFEDIPLPWNQMQAADMAAEMVLMKKTLQKLDGFWEKWEKYIDRIPDDEEHKKEEDLYNEWRDRNEYVEVAENLEKYIVKIKTLIASSSFDRSSVASTQKQEQSLADDLRATAAKNAEDAYDKVKDLAQRGKEKVADVAHAGKEKAQELGDRAKENAEDASDKAKDLAEAGKEKAQELGDRAKEKADDASDKAKDLAQRGKEKANELGDRAKEKADNASEKTKDAAQLRKERWKWKGSLYERLVALVKNSLKICIGKRSINLNEFSALLCEIESTLNTRPLTYVHGKEPFVIRPADFIYPSIDLNMPTFENDNESSDPSFMASNSAGGEVLAEKYFKGLEYLDRFWRLWAKDYLNLLRERNINEHRNARGALHRTPTVGEHVLVSEADLPRGSWKIAKINDVIQSADKEIRSAEIQYLNGFVTRRAINQLYPLEEGAVNIDISNVNDFSTVNSVEETNL